MSLLKCKIHLNVIWTPESMSDVISGSGKNRVQVLTHVNVTVNRRLPTDGDWRAI